MTLLELDWYNANRGALFPKNESGHALQRSGSILEAGNIRLRDVGSVVRRTAPNDDYRDLNRFSQTP